MVIQQGSNTRNKDNCTKGVLTLCVLTLCFLPGMCPQELDIVDEKRAIVFVNTKRQCDNVYAKLESLGHR